jgi:hypothetical protein
MAPSVSGRALNRSDRVNHMERQWLAQFRAASEDLMRFYLTMPQIQESWSPTGPADAVRYVAYSRVSDDLMIQVSQTFEFTRQGAVATSDPEYHRVEVFNEEIGRTSRSLKTSSQDLTPVEFQELYRKYNIGMPRDINPVFPPAET